MSHKVQMFLVIGTILMASVGIAACAGSAAPAVSPTIVPATLAASDTATAPSTNVPATSAPTVAASTATEAAPATSTQAAAPATATQETAPTTAPTEASATTTTAQSASNDSWVDPTPGEFTKEDTDHIFPPGRGQDLIFQNCTNCHSWVPIVFARMDKDGWEQNKINHENRITALGQDDRDFLYNYILTNFPPDKEPPDNIPQSLLDQWTSY